MATSQSTYFTAEATKYPIPALYGPRTVTWTGTVDPATSLAADGDIYYLIPLPYGKGTILRVEGEFAALDSGSDLDMDIVLLETDADGDATVTTIYDASAESNQIGRTATTCDKLLSQEWDVSDHTTLPAIGLKAVTDAATDASGTVTLSVTYQQTNLGP